MATLARTPLPARRSSGVPPPPSPRQTSTVSDEEETEKPMGIAARIASLQLNLVSKAGKPVMLTRQVQSVLVIPEGLQGEDGEDEANDPVSPPPLPPRRKSITVPKAEESEQIPLPPPRRQSLSPTARTRRPSWKEIEARGDDFVRAVSRNPPPTPSEKADFSPVVPGRRLPPKPARLPPPEPETVSEPECDEAVEEDFSLENSGSWSKCHDFSFVDPHAARFPRETVVLLDQLAFDLTSPQESETEKFRPPKPARLPPPEPETMSEPECDEAVEEDSSSEDSSSWINCHDFSFVDPYAAQFPRETIVSLDQLASDLTSPWESETEKFRPPKPARLPPPEPETMSEPECDEAVEEDSSSCLKCHDFSFVDDYAAHFPRETVVSLDQLANDLTSPWESETEKFRAIFTWLHYNIAYDAESFFCGNVQPCTPESTLRSGLGVCDGYATLFADLSTRTGLEAMKVTGHGKGFGYTPTEGGPLPQYKGNHAWNCAHMDGDWRLVDSCWGAGSVNGAASGYVKGFNPAWFTYTNAEFGKKHFPEDPGYQLLSDDSEGGPVSWEDYLKDEDRYFLMISSTINSLLKSSLQQSIYKGEVGSASICGSFANTCLQQTLITMCTSSSRLMALESQ